MTVKVYMVIVSTLDKRERDQVLAMLETFEEDIPNAQVSTTEEDYEPDDKG